MDTKTREDRIRERAYLIWLRAGEPAGQEKAHWAKACDEIDEEDGQAATHGEPIASSALPTAEEFASPPEEKPVAIRDTEAVRASPGSRGRRKGNGHIGAGV